MKKSPRKTASRTLKPTAAQLRDAEYSGEIRHLSSGELQHRMHEHAAQSERLSLDIAEINAKRVVLQRELTRIERQRAILSHTMASRLCTVQL